MSSMSGVIATAPSTPRPPAFDTAATTSRQWLKARIGNSMPRRSQTGVRIPRFCGYRKGTSKPRIAPAAREAPATSCTRASLRARASAQGDFEDPVDLVDEVERHLLTDLLRHVVEVGLVARGEDDLLQAGAVRREDLLLHATD